VAASPEEKPSRTIQSPLRTPEQVGRRLGVSRDVVVVYYETGELPGMDMSPHPNTGNRMLRFFDDDVDRLIEKRRSRAIVLPRPRQKRRKRRSN
jgi:predicted site-specific integrase-resolvase